MEMRKLLLLANMLRPGSINAGEGWVLYNSNFIERSKPFYAEHLYEAVKAANVANWPPFQEVSIRDAWLWLESADCLSSGVGTGPLGRAWAALSQIIKSSLNDDSSIQLIWVLIGLEALYAEGNLGLREQLVTKTEVLLGRREKNKKDFGAIYDYRSRLIHGNVDLPFSYMLFDSSKEHDAFRHELTRRSALALAVLIATLQLMASRSWTALEFTLSVSGRHVAPRDGGH